MVTMNRDQIMKTWSSFGQELLGPHHIIGAWAANGIYAPTRPGATYDPSITYVWLLCQTQPEYGIVALIPNEDWLQDPTERICASDSRVRTLRLVL